jgi:hypothetical protein
MQVTNNEIWKHELQKSLKEIYNSIDVQSPGTAYLGMDIRRGIDLKDIYISQPKLTSDIIQNYITEFDKSVCTPSKLDITDIEYEEDDVSVEQISQSQYLSLVMKLMYLARLTRPDILFSVTYLASKSQRPTKRNWREAIRVVKYLASTKSYGIHINCSDLNMFAHCDASYGTHNDGKGHTGFIISLGESLSYIHSRSSKQKVGSVSSTDAEIIAAKSCCQMIKWLRNILRELDIETTKPTILFQDNKSAIIVYTSDKSNYRRVKHMLTSIGYIKSLVQSNDIRIKYLSTENMTADILTKSLNRKLHQQHTTSCGVKDLSQMI